MRLDLYLVQYLNVESRNKAQDLIEKNKILVNGKIINKSSHLILETETNIIEIIDSEFIKYVSRAGLKLESALQYLHLDVSGDAVLDLGQSTGGFTDCLLKKSARFVLGVDVGTGQLHHSLRSNPNCVSIEKLNIKDMQSNPVFIKQTPIGGFDFLVADVSFISVEKYLNFAVPHLKKTGKYLFLIKPQFECGPNGLDSGGRVKDQKFYITLEENMRRLFKSEFGNVADYFKSGLDGKDGNVEFFIYGQKV